MLLGSVYLQKLNSGYSSTIPSSKTSETIVFFFFFFNAWETDKQNHFIHGINVPLTYKLNLKKMSLFLRNAYKGKKLFFMTEKSFTVDQLIKHFGPKVQFNLKKNCHTGTVWENISISRISMGKNKLSLFQKKSFL